MQYKQNSHNVAILQFSYEYDTDTSSTCTGRQCRSSTDEIPQNKH